MICVHSYSYKLVPTRTETDTLNSFLKFWTGLVQQLACVGVPYADVGFWSKLAGAYNSLVRMKCDSSYVVSMTYEMSLFRLFSFFLLVDDSNCSSVVWDWSVCKKREVVLWCFWLIAMYPLKLYIYVWLCCVFLRIDPIWGRHDLARLDHSR